MASGAKTLARMLPATGAAAHWVATQGEPVASKTAPANVGSVLERVALPAPDLPSRDLPLRPEVRQAANNAWDAATPQDRQRMQSLPGWQGQLARERAAQFAQADQGILAGSPVAALFDPRAEGRTKTLIAKGEHPDFARRAAREGAAAGVAPGQEVKALGGTVQPSTYDFETKNLFDLNRPANLLNTTVGRGVAKGGLGLGKGVVGIAQLIEDGIGADDATKQRTADRANALRSMEQAIGERGTHLQRNAEGAIASITQQLPMPGPVHTNFGDRVARPGGWMQGARAQQGRNLASAGNAADGPRQGNPKGRPLPARHSSLRSLRVQGHTQGARLDWRAGKGLRDPEISVNRP